MAEGEEDRLEETEVMVETEEVEMLDTEVTEEIHGAGEAAEAAERTEDEGGDLMSLDVMSLISFEEAWPFRSLESWAWLLESST